MKMLLTKSIGNQLIGSFDRSLTNQKYGYFGDIWVWEQKLPTYVTVHILQPVQFN